MMINKFPKIFPKNSENFWISLNNKRSWTSSYNKGGFPLIAETTRGQFLQQKFGAKAIAANIT